MSNQDSNTPNDTVQADMTQTKKGGVFSLPNDNIVKTIVVALLLCLLCSIVVSTAAIVLKPKQVENKQLDKKSNILSVAGLVDDASNAGDAAAVDALFSSIETKVVELSTGEYTDAVDPLKFDQRKASKDPAYRVALTSEQDIAQIGGVSKFANVYLLREGEQIKKIIIPIKGYGLWSTMYGFICLQGDATTVSRISFYEHGETPGLGGEIENPKWQATWENKQAFDADGKPALHLIKGTVSSATTDAQYKIDGLAGATLTSTGVTNLIHFWLGKDAFGPYLAKLRQQSPSVTEPATQSSNDQNGRG